MAEKIEIDVIAHDNATGVLKSIGGSLARIGETALGFLTAQVIPRMLDGIADFGGSIIKNAMDAQDSMAQLDAVLKSTGGTAGITADMANELADSMLNLTKFDDEAAISAETVLLQFTKISKEAFPDALKLSADLATRLGTDLTSAAQMVGKALGDPAEGIGRLNMQFRLFNDEELKSVTAMAAAGDVAKAQEIIMDRLREKIGGAAEAAGKTFSGQLAILKNQVDNVKESIGLRLLPILTQFIGKITAWLSAGGADMIAKWAGIVIDWIGRAASIIANFGNNAGGIAARIQVLWDAIKTGVQQVAENVGPFVSEVLGKLGAWFQENEPLIREFGAALLKSFQELLPVVTAVWNTLSPLLLGIVDLLLGLATLVMQIATGDWKGAWETIKQIVVDVGRAIWDAVVGFLNLIAATMGGSLEGIRAQWASNWEQFKQIVASIFEIIVNTVRQKISAVATAFNGIVTAIQKAISWIRNLASEFAKLIIPDWLTPGSPTPFELGLLGISDALQKVSGNIPNLSGGFGRLSPVPIAASQNTDFARQQTVQRSVVINVNANLRNVNDLNYFAQEMARRIG